MCSFGLAALLVVGGGRLLRRLLEVEGFEGRIELVLLLLLLLYMLLMVMGWHPVGVRVGSGLWMLLSRGERLLVVVPQVRLLLLELVALLWRLAGVVLVLRSWALRLC